jgi:hypothetical protein
MQHLHTLNVQNSSSSNEDEEEDKTLFVMAL